MLVDREGRFRAYPLEISVGETGPNKLTTVVIGFKLTEEYLDGQWRDCESDGLTLGGWFYIEKKDGDVNEFQVKQLRDSFQWDGRDVFWFEDTDLSNFGVQLEVKKETYNGTERFKIAYLHAGDSDPDKRTQRSDENVRRSVNSRLGMKLRALAGKAPTTPIPVKPELPEVSTPADEAWELFKGKCPADWKEQRMQAEWFTVLAILLPDKKPADFLPEDWVKFNAECGDAITPF